MGGATGTLGEAGHFRNTMLEADATGNAFHNVAPRSREARLADRDKDLLEKSRLKCRQFGFVRHDPVANPVLPTKQAPYYAEDVDRFRRNFIEEEHGRREARLEFYEEKLIKKRNGDLDREQKRWDAMEREHKAEEQRLEKLHHRPAARNNRCGLPVNPITMGYDSQRPDVDNLKERDDRFRQRVAARSQNLYTKMHVTGFDIITGNPRNVQVEPKNIPPTTGEARDPNSTRPW
ncbi:unnamed protein product [Pedinophyceae sp. YPF-701]|nr:unnamed protein product [Pedinophyceae sp. YPF-701]